MPYKTFRALSGSVRVDMLKQKVLDRGLLYMCHSEQLGLRFGTCVFQSESSHLLTHVLEVGDV